MSSAANAPHDVIPAPVAPRIPFAQGPATFPVGRVWCVGRNYDAHAREMASSDPHAGDAAPFFFLKPASSLLPCPAAVPRPRQATTLHHEVELLVAVGQGGVHWSRAEAAAAVAGVGVAVDLTCRDLQAAAKAKGRPWALAKGFDHAAPVGALVPGPLPPGDTQLTLTVNGEARQSGHVRDMRSDPLALLVALSQQVRVLPGDVLLTGTPSGVGPLVVGDAVCATVGQLPPVNFTLVAPGQPPEQERQAALTANDVLDFWFPESPDFSLWFTKDAAQDARIRARFEPTLQRAAAGALDHWAETPRGRLALVVLLDQLSRNIYRGTPASFSQDARARQLVVDGMELGHDRALSPIEAAFFYMPLEHGESLDWQDRSLSAFTALLARAEAEGAEPLDVFRSFVTYAERHRDVIVEFGRYPHRNAIFGRTNTAEEDAYLAKPGAGF